MSSYPKIVKDYTRTGVNNRATITIQSGSMTEGSFWLVWEVVEDDGTTSTTVAWNYWSVTIGTTVDCSVLTIVNHYQAAYVTFSSTAVQTQLDALTPGNALTLITNYWTDAAKLIEYEYGDTNYSEGSGPCPNPFTFETRYDMSTIDSGMTINF